ncbi:inositol phosphosphingolipids phospholipase C [[Candida] jaroonii]|uniref:Inositol phosphosphingolipids phospholipase C n=1 Tax=[Candida] jaroonii TaxID=467808 RepID=A0ACA9Y9N7_9ASCO|nr:inositol phosphosphingolipids phospholipase C [[Candida] jaroonii]
MSEEIKLLTFNVWGLKFISKVRRERIRGIVDKLLDGSENYDIITLQEVWCEEDWKLFDENLQQLYPYRRWFKSGIIAGPGLAIISKIPIVETFLYRFPINGRSIAVNRGDFYVGKSLAISKLSNGLVVMNSHMHAPYSLAGDDAYVAHRSVQAWDIVKIINLYNELNKGVILVGDLNSRPQSLPHKLFTNIGQLKDSWEVLKYKSNEPLLSLKELSELEPKDQILTGGITCDSQLNTWRKDRRLDEACRLDYALINDKLDVLDASVKFVDKLPHLDCSYSDHFAYYTKLKFKPSKESPENVTDHYDQLSIYKELIGEIDNYLTFTIPKHYDWRGVYFFCSIFTILFSIFVTPFSGSFSIFFVVLSTFVSITGVLNGLIWFISGNYEKRNFEEVKLQVLDHIRGIEYSNS